jgi:ribosomal protein L6P/L9E
MKKLFFLEKNKNQWQEHLGNNWFGIQSSFSLLYYQHNKNFYVFPTNKNIYFYIKTSLNKNIFNPISKIENIIEGTSLGFSVKMRLVGVGYRIEEEKINNIKFLKLKLGLSHDLDISLKRGINFKKFHERSSIYIFTFENLQILKNFTTKIRMYRSLEPYKGKGFRYVNELFKRKQGKKTNL